MKAEDTVMNKLELEEITSVGYSSIWEFAERIAKAQAESTGKIMKQEGIKAVVEWVEGHDKSTCADCLCAFDFRIDEWRTFKKSTSGSMPVAT